MTLFEIHSLRCCLGVVCVDKLSQNSHMITRCTHFPISLYHLGRLTLLSIEWS